MEKTVHDILSTRQKHKQQVLQLAALVQRDPAALLQLCELLQSGAEVEKGTAAEVFKLVSLEAPALLLPHIPLLVENIDNPAPRVRWGCPEALGNLARHYPRQVAAGIPRLLANMTDKSTVVRWCAAFALAQIALHNRQQQPRLLELFDGFIHSEQNNGVRNVFVRAVKAVRAR